MNVMSQFEVVDASSLNSGDLFFMYLGNEVCVCMILTQQPASVTIAVLQMPNANRPIPFWLDLTSPGKCLSIRSEAVFELVRGAESVPGAPFDHRGRPGIVEMHPDGKLTMRIWPFDIVSRNSVDFDLRTNTLAEGSSYSSGYFSRWKIWENETARTEVGAQPLVDFNYA